MNDLNKWAADQCGVEIIIDEVEIWYKPKELWEEWTLNDARCREIVREHFRIATVYLNYGNKGNWRSLHGSIDGIGKTIAEAEIACIKEIKALEESK